ncbi:MAG: hypothetical protein CL623_01870 [Arcobacter sp.]|mgnify:CR=1 FL=1|nr:hypothetical protein [Arcobacter sp.]|tara:strand:- start:17688 stop:18017 length:330 start_codon:yes stop_codon:yes gene_type:complete
MSLKKEYLEDEAKKGFENWTKEGWEFLLQTSEYKELAVSTLSKILDIYQRVEFKYNNSYYEVFDAADGGYMINIYSSDEKDEDGYYLEVNITDGGLCTGTNKDAIEFML